LAASGLNIFSTMPGRDHDLFPQPQLRAESGSSWVLRNAWAKQEVSDLMMSRTFVKTAIVIYLVIIAIFSILYFLLVRVYDCLCP
jgi:hypothetical protein